MYMYICIYSPPQFPGGTKLHGTTTILVLFPGQKAGCDFEFRHRPSRGRCIKRKSSVNHKKRQTDASEQ